jgi:hypothetical protein
MNNKYSFILDQLKFSYSSGTCYETCPKAFKYRYIDAEKQQGNFYSDFGNICHEALQKYMEGKLEVWDLAKYYTDHYSETVTHSPPPYPKDMAQKYFDEGLNFFENFEFELAHKKIIAIEESLEFKLGKYTVVAKPDLILLDETTNEYILYDYKTSKLKNEKDHKEREYAKQMNLYCYAAWIAKDIEIAKIRIWFLRNNIVKELPVDPMAIQETNEWLQGIIDQVYTEEKFNPKTDNTYFCRFLCGSNHVCPYWLNK